MASVKVLVLLFTLVALAVAAPSGDGLEAKLGVGVKAEKALESAGDGVYTKGEKACEDGLSNAARKMPGGSAMQSGIHAGGGIINGVEHAVKGVLDSVTGLLGGIF